MKTGHSFGLAILDGTDQWVRRTERGGGGGADSQSHWKLREMGRATTHVLRPVNALVQMGHLLGLDTWDGAGEVHCRWKGRVSKDA